MLDLRLRIYDPEYDVVECVKCMLRNLSPIPSEDLIHLCYPSIYYDGRDAGNLLQAERYEKQAAYLPDDFQGTILDVGCAGGDWLKTVKCEERECFGYDLFKSPFKVSEIDIRHGTFSEIDFPSEFFDIINAWGVMEHVHYPSDYFRTIQRLLKPDGIFIFGYKRR